MGVKQGFQNKGSRDQNVQKVLAVTTSTLTLTNRHTEFLITNRGTATASVVTLPAPATCKGKRIFYAVIGDYAMTFSLAGKITTLNNAAADAVKFAASGQLIGQTGFFLSDGTTWQHHANSGLASALPSSVATSPGTAAGGIGRTGSVGGATTIATTGTGGAGGALTDTGGAGGSASAAATAATGGAGGAVTETGGAGGAEAVAGVDSTGGAGGAVASTGGAGGAVSAAVSGTATGGAGGSGTIAGGVGGAVTATSGTNIGGAGGAALVTAGNGGAASGATDTGGVGGAVTITAGTGGAGDTGGAGGDINLVPGAVGSGGSPVAGVLTVKPGGTERWRFTAAGVLNSLATIPANAATADGAVLATGGLAFTDVANAWIDDATQGSGTVAHYIGNQTITTSSDKRLKKDIKNTERDADKILKALRVVDFTWDDPTDRHSKYGKHSRGRYMGFIGQEMADVTPWAVNVPGEAQKCATCKAGKECKEHEGQYWFAEYHYIVPPLVKAYQEMAARVERLEAALSKLL